MENGAGNMLPFHHPAPFLFPLQPHQQLSRGQVRDVDAQVEV